MSNVKERLFGAITVMSEEDAQKLWRHILSSYGDGWDVVEEAEPDEIDLQMLRDAQNDPACQEFASEEEVRRVLG